MKFILATISLLSILFVAKKISISNNWQRSPPKEDIVAEKLWTNGTDSFFILTKEGKVISVYCGKGGSKKYFRENLSLMPYNIIVLLKSLEEILPGKTPDRFGGKSASTPGDFLEEVK